MAARTSQIKQGDAKKLFKAALEAGYGAARITYHPDGRLEALATRDSAQKPADEENAWDVVLP